MPHNRFIVGQSRVAIAGGQVNFLEHRENGAAATTFSFSGFALGAEDPTRRIVCVVGGHRSQSVARTIASIALDGSPLTIHTQISAGDPGPSANAAICMGIASIAVPTGTTGTLVVNLDSNGDGIHVSTWRMVDLVSGTPYATATGAANGGNPSTTLAVPAQGVIVAGYSGCIPTTGTVSWTGATEDWDEDVECAGSDWWGSGASQYGLAADPARAISVSGPATGREIVIAASWR